MAEGGRNQAAGRARRAREAEIQRRRADRALLTFSSRPKTGMALPLVAVGLLFLIAGFGTVSRTVLFGCIFMVVGLALVVGGLALYAKRV